MGTSCTVSFLRRAAGRVSGCHEERTKPLRSGLGPGGPGVWPAAVGAVTGSPGCCLEFISLAHVINPGPEGESGVGEACEGSGCCNQSMK